MTSFVLDCSVSMAWCFEDEHTPGTQRILHSLKSDEAIVPGFWHIETANTLLNAERRGRITEAKSKVFIESLRKLKIRCDQETSQKAFYETFLLGRHHHLTSYDAAYLELAMRKGLPLATNDVELQRAAAATGISLMEM